MKFDARFPSSEERSVRARRALCGLLALAAVAGWSGATAQSVEAGARAKRSSKAVVAEAQATKQEPRQEVKPVPEAPLPRPVSLIRPKAESWVAQIEAHGNIQPWQEIHISAEVGGLRVASVLAGVGDVVKKGQVLARLNSAPVENELDAANAQLVEAKASLVQAAATLERAARLAPSGGVSKQELTLYETQKHTAEARLTAARAQVKKQQLRLDLATLAAPDDGIISSRSVAEGSIVQSGSELFRLIRQGRLQWRAEVKGESLLKLSIGQEARVKSPLGEDIKGRIRQISPIIDVKTQNGWVFVDLPADTNLKAGLSVTGALSAGARKVLVLPVSALLRKEGEAVAMTVGDDGKVGTLSLQIGETRDGQVEILSGLDAQTAVIADGLDALKAGDSVIVQTPTAEETGQ